MRRYLIAEKVGVTWPNPESRAAGPWTGAPNPRAPRLGPRGFSISVVNSFGAVSFGTATFTHASILSSIEPPLLLSGANY